MTADSEIVRVWRGAIRTADRSAYADYLAVTGMGEYRATPGNLDAVALYRDRGDGTTEVVTWSRWASMDAIRAFAGDDPERAVFYPEDDAFLVERDTTVQHFDVVG